MEYSAGAGCCGVGFWISRAFPEIPELHKKLGNGHWGGGSPSELYFSFPAVSLGCCILGMLGCRARNYWVNYWVKPSRDLPQNPKFHPWVFQRSLCLSRGVWAWINPNPTWAGAALDAPRSGWKNPSKCKEVFYCLASPCLVNSVWQCCDRVPELRPCLALLSLPFYVDFFIFF